MKNLISLGLKHETNRLFILDQTQLPHEECWIECKTPQQMIELIQRLAVRGAPLIGVAAALSLARFLEDSAPTPELYKKWAAKLRDARPTAVNLMAAVDRMTKSIHAAEKTEGHMTASGYPVRISEEIKGRMTLSSDPVRIAEEIFEEDVALCEAMAKHGAELISDGDSILTHCNTGGLATAGIGTALGVIRRAHESGKRIHVYVDETRPLFQGARLTTWELNKLGIPFTLIADNMAASLMARGKIQKVFVGSDRIARNGDAANKIGTYSVAVLAHHHRVPFYVVAPSTTVDLSCPDGAHIPIEERNPTEVRMTFGLRDCPVFNPAFDVTPRALIRAIVTDKGVHGEGMTLEN